MNTITETNNGARVDAMMRAMCKKALLVGVPEDSAPREDGAQGEDGETITNAEIGLTNEFGSPAAHIPPRPHLLPTIEYDRHDITKMMMKGARRALNGDVSQVGHTIETQMDRVGQMLEDDIRLKITSVLSPALADLTIYNRQNRERPNFGVTPLLDTGSYMKSITHFVTDL